MQVKAAQHVCAVVTRKQSPRGLAGYETLYYTRELLTEAQVRIIEYQAQSASAPEPRVVWQSYRLPSGQQVISRIVPIAEADEFGRRGRFFAHSLICQIPDERQFDEVLGDLLRPQNFFLSLEQVLTSTSLQTGHLPPVTLHADREWVHQATHLIAEWSGGQLQELLRLMSAPHRLVEAGQYVALLGSEEQILDALKVAFLLTPASARRFCAFDTQAATKGAPSEIRFWGRGHSLSGVESYVLDAAQRQVIIPESSPLLAASFPFKQLSRPLQEALRASLQEPADYALSTLLDRQYEALISRTMYRALLRRPELSLTSDDLRLLTPLGQSYLCLGLLLALKTKDEARRLQVLAAMDSRLYRVCLSDLQRLSGLLPWQVFSPKFMSIWFEFYRGRQSLDDLTWAIGNIAEHGSHQDRKSLRTLVVHLDVQQRQVLKDWLKTTSYRLDALRTALDKSVKATSDDGKSKSLWHRMRHPFGK